MSEKKQIQMEKMVKMELMAPMERRVSMALVFLT